MNEESVRRGEDLLRRISSREGPMTVTLNRSTTSKANRLLRQIGSRQRLTVRMSAAKVHAVAYTFDAAARDRRNDPTTREWCRQFASHLHGEAS